MRPRVCLSSLAAVMDIGAGGLLRQLKCYTQRIPEKQRNEKERVSL